MHQNKFQRLQHVLLPKQYVPPLHFEEFLHKLMQMLGFTESPVSYACQMYYERVMEQIARALSQIEVLKEQLIELTCKQQKQQQVHVFKSDSQMSQLSSKNNDINLQLYSLQLINTRQQKIVNEYYILTDDFTQLKTRFLQETDKNLVLENLIKILQTRLDNSIFEKIRLNDNLKELENQYLVYQKQKITETEQLQTSFNTSITQLTQKVTSLNLLNQQTAQLTRNQSSQNIHMEAEIKNLKDNLDQAYFENENLLKQVQFKQDEMDAVQGTDSAVAFRKLKKHLNDTCKIKDDQILKLQEQYKMFKTAKENDVYILQQAAINNNKLIVELQKQIQIVSQRNQQLEETLYVLQQDKKQFLENESKLLQDQFSIQLDKFIQEKDELQQNYEKQIEDQVIKIDFLYQQLENLKLSKKHLISMYEGNDDFVDINTKLDTTQTQVLILSKFLEDKNQEIDSLIQGKDDLHEKYQKLQIRFDEVSRRISYQNKNKEIVKDLESQISSLCLERLQNKQRYNIYDAQQQEIIKQQRLKLIKLEEEEIIMKETAENAIKYRKLYEEFYSLDQQNKQQISLLKEKIDHLLKQNSQQQAEINVLTFNSDLLLKEKTEDLENQIILFNNLLSESNNELQGRRKQYEEVQKQLEQSNLKIQNLNQQLGSVELHIQQDKNENILQQKTNQINLKKLERECQDLKIKLKTKQLYKSDTILDIDDEAIFKLVCFVQTLMVYYSIQTNDIESVLMGIMSQISQKF
ncbi:hypothetical protein SS50377_20136 [Spironucleus salmonicida]|uniref:Uncharacterized protein n=1 Tax=Spironucleus salmonicida TaxID=348837 RepID=V6LKW4_9EUKA|nr:hypothetical protein SS50377_20136 [Spironucleus salmonicida]|eukprot:EST45192.1 Hypothetical protein SS50377_14765 [Spironucleus salmonicida]